MACFLGKGHVDVDKCCGFAISEKRVNTHEYSGWLEWWGRLGPSSLLFIEYILQSFGGFLQWWFHKIDVFIIEHLNLIKMDDLH